MENPGTQDTETQGTRRFVYDVWSALTLAVDSIRAHKLRSFLTLLGVIIGVASVIFVGSAIEGLSVYADQSTAKAFGSESYLVAQALSAHSLKEYLAKIKHNKVIKMDDYNYLLAVDSDKSLISPDRDKEVDVKRDSYVSELTDINGVSNTIADIRDMVVVDGRFFDDQEEKNRMAVAVIGDETRAHLFPDGSSPVGKTIKISGVDFTVVGVQEKLGSAFGQSQDNVIYIPITAYNRLFGPPTGDMPLFIRARPDSGLTMDQSLDYTRVALRTRFHQKPGEADRFDTLTPEAIRGFIDTILSLVSAIVIPVTSISLVVGGIVIMNIMLVSVTERTREIGVRKALGARQRDVLMQFLIESATMALMGGAIGVLCGVGVAKVITLVIGFPTSVQLWSVLLGLFMATFTGVFFGVYPASKAAKLDPVVALRAEL